ncbi:hypothetical protein R80B4_02873 [Fibrobacteres bacterium R8-0-B4]
MLTKTISNINYPADIEAVEYPDEFIEELETEAEIASLQAKTGELPHIQLEEFALKFGVDLRE